MRPWRPLLLLSAVLATTAWAQPPVSATAVGLYEPKQKIQLAPAFINSVTLYLHRYKTKVVTQGADYVKMRVKYDLLYNVELKINADNYEIKVTLAQKTYRLADAQKKAAHLATGIYKAMADNASLR